LEIAEPSLQRLGFGVQRRVSGGHAIVVGPSDVVGVGLRDRGAAARTIALIENPRRLACISSGMVAAIGVSYREHIRDLSCNSHSSGLT
jgi:hypothetical protein